MQVFFEALSLAVSLNMFLVAVLYVVKNMCSSEHKKTFVIVITITHIFTTSSSFDIFVVTSDDGGIIGCKFGGRRGRY